MFFVFKWIASGKISSWKTSQCLKTSLEISPIQLLYVTKHLQTLKKLACTNLKFDLKLVTLVNNSLETWSFQQPEKPFAHTSILKVKTFNNLKNFLPHFLKLQCWNLQQLEKLFFTHIELKTWNLKTWRTFFHTWKILEHFEEVFSTPPTHLEKLQAPCMPPLGNELPLTLQTKTPSFKKDFLVFSI
jgi:hypothetical protein